MGALTHGLTFEELIRGAKDRNMWAEQIALRHVVLRFAYDDLYQGRLLFKLGTNGRWFRKF